MKYEGIIEHIKNNMFQSFTKYTRKKTLDRKGVISNDK